MWPHKKLKILVPRTPPDPPLPPLTPPRGPGGPKMAKMHSLKSIDDNLCQKSHFWGVKKIDLFFHSECTSYNAVLVSVWQTQWHSWISIASKYWTHAQPGMRPFVSPGRAYIFGNCENQKIQYLPKTKGWRFHVVLVWCPNCQSAKPLENSDIG